MKAELDLAGEKNHEGLEYKFTPFSPREIEQHLSLYIFQGINPSPQLVLKTRPQSIEPVQGNDLIHSKLGKNFERRHRQFRRYFASQHPYKPVPPIHSHPNWKVDPFMNHLNKVSMQAAVLPEKLSVDEQTIMFHGSSKLKSRIKYKKPVMASSVIPSVQMDTQSYSIIVTNRHQKHTLIQDSQHYMLE